ncbi:hypothetical protein [Mycobacterium sp. IS-3022]|uniref:hypothetical protein n=1 Tax=Mycobacterium sp. IS-3022 TaxID=1772277 RepID=UPI0007416721|nr:hypothetical protein [Mycobacterium sp. IS-3022]KUH93942.1 hypothetical protein AU188_07945 [Mycobacterium sp. IS-3022]
MQVTRAHFEELESGAVPGFAMKVYVEGEDFEPRAVPLQARVGEQRVDQLFVAPDGSGFAGVLAEIPNDGDRLLVRYAEAIELTTNVVFGSEVVG